MHEFKAFLRDALRPMGAYYEALFREVLYVQAQGFFLCMCVLQVSHGATTWKLILVGALVLLQQFQFVMTRGHLRDAWLSKQQQVRRAEVLRAYIEDLEKKELELQAYALKITAQYQDAQQKAGRALPGDAEHYAIPPRTADMCSPELRARLQEILALAAASENTPSNTDNN